VAGKSRSAGVVGISLVTSIASKAGMPRAGVFEVGVIEIGALGESIEQQGLEDRSGTFHFRSEDYSTRVRDCCQRGQTDQASQNETRNQSK
jgi:hypothetical protein